MLTEEKTDMTNEEVREALEKELSMPYEDLVRLHPTAADFGTEFIDYSPQGELTLAYPLKPAQRNGYKLLQGGYIAAFFDNNYGIFSYISTKGSPMPTVNLTVNFHKAVLEDTSKIFVSTRVVSAGRKILSMAGEARNERGDLIATCQANILNTAGAQISI